MRRAATPAGLILALIGFVHAASAAETKNVLVLFSNSRLLPANVEGERGLRETFARSTDRRVEMYAEFLDAPHFSGERYSRNFADYLAEKYASRPPDVIVAAASDALGFLLQYRTQFFPRTPIVHMGVSRSHLRSIPPLPADVVGIPVEYEFSGTIEQALRWHPKARRLVIVTGASSQDREFEARLRRDVAPFAGRVTAEFLAGLPTEVLMGQLRALGGDAVVFTPGWFEDGDGHATLPREAARIVAGAAAAPVYSPYNTFLGTGIVGGRMQTFEAMARQTAEIVQKLLAGAAPASLPLPEVAPTEIHLDWGQARRWGIRESDVPVGAVWHFRVPSFWEEHWMEAVGALVVFLLQGALIGGLLLERRRRRGAELATLQLRSDLARASRLTMAGELVGAIAHEINQPLGAILSNADTADLLLDAGADRRDLLRQILSDIRRDDLRASEVIRRLRALLAKNEVERVPYDLAEVMSGIEPLLRAEARRRGVTLLVRSAPAAVTLVGDRIQLQQVLINLVLNAMDAVADVSEERRTVILSAGKVEGGVVLEVRDRGIGIPPENLPKLFDSFFTTKKSGMGLGLSIARSLVEAQGGRIRAENGPDEGATFRVELPVSGGPGFPQPEPA